MNRNSEPRVLSLLLARQAAKLGDQPFLYYQDSVFTFSGLFTMAGRMAAGLRDAGIKRGEMVCVMLPNCPEFIALSFGISFLGGIEVPINLHHRGDILAYMIRNSDAGTIIIDAGLIDQIAELEEIPGNVSRMIIRRAPGDNRIIPDLGLIEVIDMAG